MHVVNIAPLSSYPIVNPILEIDFLESSSATALLINSARNLKEEEDNHTSQPWDGQVLWRSHMNRP